MNLRISVAALAAALMFAAPALAEGMHHAPPAAEERVGDLTIAGAFARATLPNQPVGGGYLTITNGGTNDDRLVAAASPVAGEVQLHEMTMEGDVMKMRQLKDGIAVPAGATVTLEPGGLHLMFMKLKGPLVEGQAVEVTLAFEKAGSVTVTLPVLASSAAEPEAHGMAHHGAMAPVDASHLTDEEAIAAMQKAMFDTPEKPLEMGPIVVSGEYAVSDWAQAGAGGRALLRKTEKGWGIHLCAGASLKDAAALVTIGVPEAAAQALAAGLAAAEAALPAEEVALYDSFAGEMMVDEGLI